MFAIIEVTQDSVGVEAVIKAESKEQAYKYIYARWYTEDFMTPIQECTPRGDIGGPEKLPELIKRFNSRKLSYHLVEMPTTAYDASNIIFDESSEEEDAKEECHIFKHSEQMWSCALCTKSFSTRPHAINHVVGKHQMNEDDIYIDFTSHLHD